MTTLSISSIWTNNGEWYEEGASHCDGSNDPKSLRISSMNAEFRSFLSSIFSLCLMNSIWNKTLWNELFRLVLFLDYFTCYTQSTSEKWRSSKWRQWDHGSVKTWCQNNWAPYYSWLLLKTLLHNETWVFNSETSFGVMNMVVAAVMNVCQLSTMVVISECYIGNCKSIAYTHLIYSSFRMTFISVRELLAVCLSNITWVVVS